jgi:hypothetical protein
MGVIVNPNDYRVGISPEQNSSSQAAGGASAKQKADDKKKAGRTVRSRVPFSKSDDLFLLNSLANNGSSANTAGNALYKEMARKEPHHTMHSWRSRWYEHLKNIVPEDDLWGPNPCYGDNATRKPGPLAVTRMRVADRGSDSEEGNTSRRRSSGVNRRQSNQDTLQKQRLQVRQQQHEDFEQEALAREEEEQRGTGQTKQIKRPAKSKFSLADDNQLAVLHSVIPTLPDAKKIAMFSKLAKKVGRVSLLLLFQFSNMSSSLTIPPKNGKTVTIPIPSPRQTRHCSSSETMREKVKTQTTRRIIHNLSFKTNSNQGHQRLAVDNHPQNLVLTNHNPPLTKVPSILNFWLWIPLLELILLGSILRILPVQSNNQSNL